MATTVYTAKATSKGGRTGHTEGADGKLSFDMAPPPQKGAQKEAGQKDAQKAGQKPATNPEDLFAAAYATCYGSAFQHVAQEQKIDAKNAIVTAEVSINKDGNGSFLSAALDVTLPGVAPEQVQKLMEEAHQICPYSKATRGNMDVTLKVNSQPFSRAA